MPITQFCGFSLAAALSTCQQVQLWPAAGTSIDLCSGIITASLCNHALSILTGLQVQLKSGLTSSEQQQKRQHAWLHHIQILSHKVFLFVLLFDTVETCIYIFFKKRVKCYSFTLQKWFWVCALMDDSFCLVHSIVAYIHCYHCCFWNGVLRFLPPPWYRIGTVLDNVKDKKMSKKKKEFVNSHNCYPNRTLYVWQTWIKTIELRSKN